MNVEPEGHSLNEKKQHLSNLNFGVSILVFIVFLGALLEIINDVSPSHYQSWMFPFTKPPSAPAFDIMKTIHPEDC